MTIWKPLRSAIGGAVLAAIAAGCTLNPYSDDSIAKRGAEFTRLAHPAGEPQAFVREQRPAQPTTFMPVGVSAPKRDIEIRTAEEAAALEAALAGERDRTRAFATRPAPKTDYDGTPAPKVEPPPKELMPQ